MKVNDFLDFLIVFYLQVKGTKMKTKMLALAFSNQLLQMIQATRFAKMEFELTKEMLETFYNIKVNSKELYEMIAYLKKYNFVYIVDETDGSKHICLSHDLVSRNQNYEINKYYSQFYHIEGF